MNIHILGACDIVDRKIVDSLQVFFGEMHYTLIEQQGVYTWVSLFGELGGQLGLCLGASVLTIVELLQLLGVLCSRLCERPSAKHLLLMSSLRARKVNVLSLLTMCVCIPQLFVKQLFAVKKLLTC